MFKTKNQKIDLVDIIKEMEIVTMVKMCITFMTFMTSTIAHWGSESYGSESF